MTDAMKEIEQVLGRPLDPRWCGAVIDLNVFPPALLDDARRLADDPWLLRIFLFYVVAPEEENRSVFDGFTRDVIRGGADLATWRRGGLLSPDWSLVDQLQLSADTLLAPLQRKPDEVWLQIIAERDRWERGEDVGAPTVARPSLTYRTPVKPHVMSYDPASVQVAPVREVTIAVRRWIASRIARCALTVGLLDAHVEGAALIERLAPGHPPLSGDAHIALAALLAESRLPDPTTGVPGFRGPDAWYGG